MRTDWERDWWGTCQNTYGEEFKQLLYAEKMRLAFHHNGKSPFNIDMQGKSVLDIGGGPCSLLLKCVNVRGKVVDPCDYPPWVYDRYKLAGIEVARKGGEEIDETGFDEAWIYNCLQHTVDPQRIVANALRAAKIVRVFEWIETRVNEGHPHSFTEEQLNQWFQGIGKTEVLKGRNTLVGTCYYGVFRGVAYEEV